MTIKQAITYSVKKFEDTYKKLEKPEKIDELTTQLKRVQEEKTKTPGSEPG